MFPDLTRRMLLAFLLIACSPEAQSNDAQFFDIQVIETPGGITAWFVEEHSIPVISVQVIFPGGASQDPVGSEGLAYFASTMLDEGAGDLVSREFQRRTTELGVRLGFRAGMDTFSASFATLSERRHEAFELLRLALTSPRLDQDAIERMRSQILVGLARDETDPDEILARAWYGSMFGNHPYGRPREGSVQTVSGIGRDDLAGYVTRQLTTDGMILAVVGDTTPDELAVLLDETFGGLPATPNMMSVAGMSEPLFGEGGFEIVDHPIPQTVVMFGGPGIQRDDPDFYAAYVLNYILGGGSLASRLAYQVREQRGLAYYASSYLSTLHDAGLFIGVTGTTNERVEETIEVIRNEIETVANGGIRQEELDAAITYIVGSYPLNFDSNARIANAIVQVQYEGLGIDYFERRNDIFRAITLEDLERAAERILRMDDMIWVLVGAPEGEFEGATRTSGDG